MRVCVKEIDGNFMGVFESQEISYKKTKYDNVTVSHYEVNFDKYVYDILATDKNKSALEEGIKWINNSLSGGVFLISDSEMGNYHNIVFNSVDYK